MAIINHLFTLCCAVMLLIFIPCCKKYTLRAHTEYVSIQDLASYHVGTPDPMLCNPPTGQRLMIHWKIPSTFLNDSCLQLKITLRFCNRKEIQIKVPVEKARGTYCYSLMNEDYIQAGGIRSFIVLLEGTKGIYECLKHLLWRDLITIHSLDKLDERPPIEEENNRSEEEDDEEEYEDDDE